MSGWNEQTLRTAASWQAFKEGKALFESGCVSAVKAGSSGWQGSVTHGKRPIRVSVTVKSATDLETRCSCPENQSTGALCRHAVATGLAALAGKSPAATPAPTSSQAPAPVLARDVVFPPQWREALTRGKLSATLTPSPRREPDPADLRLSTWLAGQGAAASPSLNLHLDGSRAAALLDLLAGHPGVFAGRDKTPLAISIGHRMLLSSAEHRGEEILLVPLDDADAPWVEIGGSFWQVGGDFLNRAGSANSPTIPSDTLRRLAAGKSVTVSVRELLSKLDAWQDWVSFPENCWLESLHFIPAAASFELELKGSLQRIEARLLVSYPDAPPVVPGLGMVPNLPSLSGTTCSVRDHAAEHSAAARLERAGLQSVRPESGLWELSGESAVLRFLTQTLPALRQSWRVTEDARFTLARKQVAIVSPKIDILGSGEDWLSFDFKFQTDDGIEIPREEIQRLLRSGRNSGRITGGLQIAISEEAIHTTEPLFSELELEQRNGHYETTARSGEVVLEIRNKIHKHQNTCSLNQYSEFQKPTQLHATLRDYQSTGAAWLLDRSQRFGGALLADDMGLGKTIQTIALIETLALDNRSNNGMTLVVATTSLLGNWRAEFNRFTPGRKVRILHGSNRDEERERAQPGNVILTSYGTLARDLAWHLRQDYQVIVADEASLMRNPDTDHAKALAKLRGRHRIALTGTPVENGVRDLWSIFRFIQPGWLGTREDFRERYEMPLAAGEGGAAVMSRLKLRISPFVLRRTKEQVAKELPSKLIIDEFCDLTPDQQSVYRSLLIEGRKQVETLADTKNSGAARMRVLTTLLRLRQSCCDLALLGNDRFTQLPVSRRSSKLERLLVLLEEAVNGSHRVLVFSQFQKQLLEIEKCVLERDWSCLRLDGQTRNRQELVERFQSPQGPPIFLISLKAGGYGLNLTAADTVIHFDPWWNPAAEAQATDRAHRIGQTRPVTVYRLLTRGTVEEQVVRLQSRKRELAAAIDENGGGDAPGWSMRDFEEVICGT